MNKHEKQFGAYLHRLGYNWRREPANYKNPPDFKVEHPKGDVLCEIKTIDQDKSLKKEEETVRALINRLSQVEHPYFCGLTVKNGDLISSKEVDRHLKYIKILVEKYLDTSQPNQDDLPIKFIYSGEENPEEHEYVSIQPKKKTGDWSVKKVVSYLNEYNEYPLGSEIGGIPILSQFKLNYSDGRIELKDAQDIQAWDEPMIEIRIEGKNSELECLKFDSLMYSVFDIRLIERTKKKISSCYEKFTRLQKLPGVLVLFTDTLLGVDLHTIKSAAFGRRDLIPSEDKSWTKIWGGRGAMLQPEQYRNLSAIAFHAPQETQEGLCEGYTVLHNSKNWAFHPLDKEFFYGEYDRQIFPDPIPEKGFREL